MKLRLIAALLLLLFPLTAAAQTGSTFLDRLYGLTTASAIKAPVKCATTGPITLSGAQTIDGVAVTDHANDSTGLPPDRVLVKNQADQTTNGVYSVSSTAGWSLTGDWQGAFNAVSGTLVSVNGGATQAGLWQLTTPDPVSIAPAIGGGSNITFTPASFAFTKLASSTVNAPFYLTFANNTSGLISLFATPGIWVNPSTDTLNISALAATSTATVSNLIITNSCVGCTSGAAGSMSAITQAVAPSAFDNGNFTQSWKWNSLGSNVALSLTTTNLTSGTILQVQNTSGGSSTGYAGYFENITTGAGYALGALTTGSSNTGFAIYGSNPSATGYAGYFQGAVNVIGQLTGVDAALSGTTTITGGLTVGGNVSLAGTANVLGTIASGIWQGSVISSTYLPTATTSTFGLIKPDNSTVTISGGVITSHGSLPAAYSIGSYIWATNNEGDGGGQCEPGTSNTTQTAPNLGLPNSSTGPLSGIWRCMYRIYPTQSGLWLRIS